MKLRNKIIAMVLAVVMIHATLTMSPLVFNSAASSIIPTLPVQLMVRDTAPGGDWDNTVAGEIVNITGNGTYIASITFPDNARPTLVPQLAVGAYGTELRDDDRNPIGSNAEPAPTQYFGATAEIKSIIVNGSVLALTNEIDVRLVSDPGVQSRAEYAYFVLWHAWWTSHNRFLNSPPIVTGSLDEPFLSFPNGIASISVEFAVSGVGVATPAYVSPRSHSTIPTDLTARQVTAQMGMGWNLGNTFDAHDYSGVLGSASHLNIPQIETMWLSGFNSLTMQSLIDRVYNAGFDTIRIPVTWYKVSGTAPNHTIRTDFLDRVQSVVNMAYNKGMYVIINIHHDESVIPLNNVNNQNAGNINHPAYIYVDKIWEQVANRFRNYDEKLIFEGLNEPRVVGHLEEWTGISEFYTNLNHLNQRFVDVVRTTGGNNRNRILMISTYAANTDANSLSSFRVPNDVSEHWVTVNATNVGRTVNNRSSRKIALSVHSYAPHKWAANAEGTYSGISCSRGTTCNVFEPRCMYNNTDNDNQNWWRCISNVLNRTKMRADTLGLPVVMGEWGSVEYSYENPNNRNDNVAERERHAREYVLEIRKRGIVPVVWDDGGGFRIINRKAPHNAYFPEMINAIMEHKRNPVVPVQIQLINTNANPWQTFPSILGEIVNITGNGTYTARLNITNTNQYLRIIPQIAINAVDTNIYDANAIDGEKAIGANAMPVPLNFSNARVNINDEGANWAVNINGIPRSLTNNTNIPFISDYGHRAGYFNFDIWNAWYAPGNRLTGSMISTVLLENGELALNFSSTPPNAPVQSMSIRFTVSGVRHIHTIPTNWTSGSPSTCTTTSTRIKTCSADGCNATIETENQGALGHIFSAWNVTTAVACYANGVETRTCSRNSAHTETRSITTRPPHTTPANWTSGNPATCTTASTRIKTCTVVGCSATIETENQVALGHIFSAWNVTTAAACYANGVETRTCSRNSAHTETRSITTRPPHTPPTNWTSGSPATCTTASTRIKTCLVSACSATVETENEAAYGGLLHIKAVKVGGYDLIEIYNTADKAISTKGLYISDNDNLLKWQMPSMIIRAGQAISIADYKRGQVNFDVKSAELLRLTSADGIPMTCFSRNGDCVCG